MHSTRALIHDLREGLLSAFTTLVAARQLDSSLATLRFAFFDYLG